MHNLSVFIVTQSLMIQIVTRMAGCRQILLLVVSGINSTLLDRYICPLIQSEFVFSPFVDHLDHGFSFLFFLKHRTWI